jgi:hypothetical protein
MSGVYLYSSVCPQCVLRDNSTVFLSPEVASSSYKKESYFMGIILRNKEAMPSAPNYRPAASFACNDATGVMHCSRGR